MCAKGLFAAALAYAEEQPDRESLRETIHAAVRGDIRRQQRRARLHDATRGRLRRLLRKLTR